MMKNYNRILGAGGIALAMLLTSPVQATDKSDNAPRWEQWQSLASGYVARRKVPPKADLPVAQRRLSSVQKKLRTTVISESNVRLSKDGRKNFAKSGLWAYTGAAGLYSVSIEGLAVEWNESVAKVREKVSQGKLSVTNAGNKVSWYFDVSTDAVRFAGEAYETFYTKENAYYFSLNGAKAAPMAVNEGSPTISFGDETPYADTLKFEEEPDLVFATWSVASEPDADYWFWDYLYGGFKDLIEISLDIPNPSSVGTAQLRIKLRGWTDLEEGDEHQVYAVLNGEQVGTEVIWDGFEEAVLVANFSQDLLDPEGDNTLQLHNDYAPGTHPGQWLDDIEIDYSRLPVAKNGSLWLHNVSAGTQLVSGFAQDNIVVIEAPAGVATLREDIRLQPDGAGGWAVAFDTQAGVDYLITENTVLQSPTLALSKRSKLKRRTNRADYLIIAPGEFEGTAESLAAYRDARFGKVKIVWLEEIYAAFSYGRVDPFAVTRFMESVKKWKVSPSNVVLIGKGSIDHKDRMGYGDSFMPVVMTDTPWALAASDDRLLAGEGIPTFAIGRLPIVNDAEGMSYVEKLIDYESIIPGSERYQAVLVADNPDDAGDFHTNSDELASRLLNRLGFDNVTKLYHPEDTVRASFISSSTWEAGYVSYDGHGSASQVGDNSEKFIDAADAELLANEVHPIFTALTCAAGDDTFPGMRSLAGALVLNPTGGAIVSLAPTGLSLDADAQLLGRAFVDRLFEGNETIGNAVRAAKSDTAGTISAFMPRIYSVVGEPGIYAR